MRRPLVSEESREREGLARTQTTGGSARCLALRYFFFPFLERTRFGNHFAPGCIFLACFCASMHILSPTELSELIFLVLVRSLSLTRTVWLVEAGDDATYYKRKKRSIIFIKRCCKPAIASADLMRGALTE